MKTLECSSKGDKRFSAFGARIVVNDKLDSIENHYQLSKRFKSSEGKTLIPKTWREAKGKDVAYFKVSGRKYETKYLSAYYALLWVKYLDQNPELIEFARGFDNFTDMFRGKSVNCQADVIKQYVKQGRDAIMSKQLIKEFLTLMNQPHCVRYLEGDLLEAAVDIYGHQVNCKGAMGAGIAKAIKDKYPLVYQPYKDICKKYGKRLLGKCQLVSSGGRFTLPMERIRPQDGKIIANLFGQDGYGSGLKTEYNHLENALQELRKLAELNDLWVGLPYKIGSGLAGGDWAVVKGIIEKVFINYPVNIYKLK